MELGFSVAYLSPDRSTHRGPRDLSDPFVKGRHTFHQAFPDICAAPRSSQKAFFLFFTTLFRHHLSGISLVYPKFSTRDILLQMYPPDIQHTSKDISEHKRAPIFLISVAHLFGSFTLIVLGEASGGLHKAGLSPPSDRYFCPSSDKSSHIRPSMSFRMSLYCHSLAQAGVSTETPCSTFISSRENHSATKFIMGSICGIECRGTLVTDLVPLLLPRTVLFWSTHSTLFVSPYRAPESPF